MLDIAFDIGGMHFRSGLVDENGRVKSEVAFESPTAPEEILEHIQRTVESYATMAPEAMVGIAIGGIVEKNGNVTAGSLNMVEYPLAEKLALRRPLMVINDARAAALAEVTYNPRLCAKASFILMTISAGIGGGVIMNGEPYEGHTGAAGEVGHLIMDNGQDAYCRLGHRGCLDALASARALDNRIKQLWREGHWRQFEREVSIRDLAGLAAAKDGMALRLLRETGTWIGQGVMQIFRVLDPCELIFKGYLVGELWDYLRPHITAVVESYDFHIPMSLSAFGEHVGLVGAALAARRQFTTTAS